MDRKPMIRGAILAACVGCVGCGGEGDENKCEVAIIGGGVGGLHTAFRLGPMFGDKVCLFEKEAQLGGRLKDVSLDGSSDSPRFALGGRRVMEGQKVLFDLAAELGLQLVAAPPEADLIEARGKFAFAPQQLLSVYPSIPPAPMTDQEIWFYNQLRKGPARAQAASYPDFRDYVRSVIGVEGYNFLHDMSRFRADFEYPLDTRGYLDYLDEETDVCCTPSYPIGGMTAFVRGMEKQAAAVGVRIWKSTRVTEIRSDRDGYLVIAGEHVVKSNRLVIAVSPYWLGYIAGDVAERIRAQPQLQQIVGVRVVTMAQWFPQPWWAPIKDPTKTSKNRVWRAWTTDDCINSLEIPLEPYSAAQNVMRSVYDDDIRCVQLWEELARAGTKAVETEALRGLNYLFNDNGVADPSTVAIPTPLKTQMQVWPDAWHFLGAGSAFTNADIYNWAVEPLPGEQVALVGEAVNPQRSGWSDAAYKSSLNLLNKKYGLILPDTPRQLSGTSGTSLARSSSLSTRAAAAPPAGERLGEQAGGP